MTKQAFYCPICDEIFVCPKTSLIVSVEENGMMIYDLSNIYHIIRISEDGLDMREVVHPLTLIREFPAALSDWEIKCAVRDAIETVGLSIRP